MAVVDPTEFSVIRKAFTELNDSDFNVCILYAYGATIDEIALAAGITPAMVKKKLNRTKENLALPSVHAIRLIVSIRCSLLILNKASI